MNKKENIEISVVIPAYKSSGNIDNVYTRLSDTLENLCELYEVIFVNDGSPEKDWNIIEDLCRKDPCVKGLSFSRNFGQHNAITAGLEHSSGEWTVIMDCDLQDKPEEIQKLYNKAKEGYDIVFARRQERKDTFLKKLSSKVFYRILSYLTETEQDETVGNFGIYGRKAVDAVLKLDESMRYFPVKIRWIGFDSVSIPVEHDSTHSERSSYTFKKLTDLAMDVIIAASNKPLKLVVKLGMLISGLSFVYAVYLFIRAISGGFLVQGWPSLIVSVWFLSGIIIMILGIIGLYLGKTFDEVKNKPHYLIKEKKNI